MNEKQMKLMDLYWNYLDNFFDSKMSLAQYLDQNSDMYIPPISKSKSHEDAYCELFNYFGQTL